MESIIGKKIDVLDKGYILCTGTLGNDQEIVDSARVSYMGASKGEVADKKLLKYLYEHKHFSPFESVEMALQVKTPIFVARQWLRHRVAEINEMSLRYTVIEDEFHLPEFYRLQDAKNKQSSSGVNERSEYWRNVVETHSRRGFDIYNDMISDGIGREQAREHLGLNTYTTFRWKMNARSWMNFLTLRCAKDAQWEIRQYAIAIYNEYFKLLLPWTCEFYNPIE